MKRGTITTLILAALAILGCAGGGVQSDSSGGGDKYSSEAAVQLLPYETLRNNLVGALCLNSNSAAIQQLDAQQVLFGAASGSGPRYLGPSLARLRKHVDICDLGCQDGLKNCPKDLFDNTSDKFDPNTVCRRLLGKPLSDERREAIVATTALAGYDSDLAKQHAICVSCCSSLEAQLQ